MTELVLQVSDLNVRFPVPGGRWAQAVHSVSFEVARGETLGVVGESGSGKSTIARALLCLVPASGGEVRFRGTNLLALQPQQMRDMRRHLQIIFQDPLGSLDPRMNVGEIIAEPLREHRRDLTAAGRRDRVLAMMERVGLLRAHLNRYPHEFSGGQAQRIGIARALVLEPEVLVCDEPISALDVSIKSQIANLLKDLQQQTQLSLLFIAHDLAAVRFSCDRVLVLYLGRIMEIASPGGTVCSAASPLYPRAAAIGADPRSGSRPGPPGGAPRWRNSLGALTAQRLCIPHPLSVRRRPV